VAGEKIQGWKNRVVGVHSSGFEGLVQNKKTQRDSPQVKNER